MSHPTPSTPNPFVNFVKLTVRAGKDGELRVSSKGTNWAQCRVSLGMGKDDSGGYKPSLWLTAKAFTTPDGDDTLPQLLGDVQKGALLTLSGRLAYQEYTTDQGEKRSDLQLLIAKLEFPAVSAAPAPTAEAAFDPPL